MTVAFKTGDLVAGRFKITEELGRGAMGVVYRAHDASLDREVALKTIRFDVIGDERDARDFRERFLREARTAAKLAHPNIVTIFDVGEWEGTSYMAIEFLNGVTLQELLRPKAPLPVQETLKIAAQICRGLDEAHAHGIVHRDIKPANIMLVKGNQVKITDFGIAKVQSSATLTREGAIVGTPSYMSPEQLSDKPVDGRADIFATGAVLYEMLTGERAFPGENITTIILKVVTQQPQPVRLRNPNLPPEMEVVMERALQKDPNQRYQTMGELASDLEAIVAQHQTGTQTRTIVATLPQPVAAPVASVSAPAAPVPGGPPAIDVDLDTETEASVEVLREGGGSTLVWVALAGVFLVVVVAAVVVTMALRGRAGPGAPSPTAEAPTAVATTAPSPPAPLIPPGPSVAILPFEGKGVDASFAWLSQGLPNLFEADLAQSKKIRVVPQEEVRDEAAKLGVDAGTRLSTDSMKKLGEAVKVRTFLTGSFDVTGKVIRFDIYLYETESGSIKVTDYDKAEGESKVFAGVDNLTIRVRDALGALPDAAAGDPDRDVAQVLTGNVEALKLFLRGRDAAWRKDNQAALDEFNKAIDKDPSFVAAHARKSAIYASLGRGELEEQARREAEAKQKAKADEEAKLAGQMKADEQKRLDEMRRRAEERQGEEQKQKAAAEAEARKMAEAERHRAGKAATTALPPASTAAPATAVSPATTSMAEATSAEPSVNEGDLVELGEVSKPPQPIDHPMPEVSSALKRFAATRGQEHGRIFVEVLVDQSGKPAEAKVIRSDVPAYNDLAVDTVMKKWTFTPPEKNGVKVKTRFTVPLAL